MSRKKLLERKKKKREELSKARVLRRREQTRSEAKWMHDQEHKAKIIMKMEAKYPEQMKRYERDNLMKLPLETLKQIENNIRILKGLEDEYTREVSTRNKLNSELEELGHILPEEKFRALTPQQAQEIMAAENQKVSTGGSAECSFTVNKPKKDTADVDVVKVQPESSEPESE